MKKPLACALFAFASALPVGAQSPAPLRALLVTGGCCHDYAAQKKIIPEGISARAHVEWTIVHERDDRDHKVSIYANADWGRGYDVIVHNECYSQVNEAAFVERIAAPHKAGLPAVMLHCSSHSYRMAPTDEWRKVVGITSMSHEKRRDLLVKTLAPDHPVMRGFPANWPDLEEELYKNVKIWPGAVPLAQAYGQETKKDHVVIWVNTYHTGRVFSTTLGHTNATMQSEVYLDLVTRGLLWACGKLTESGKPAPGYGPGGR